MPKHHIQAGDCVGSGLAELACNKGEDLPTGAESLTKGHARVP